MARTKITAPAEPAKSESTPVEKAPPLCACDVKQTFQETVQNGGRCGKCGRGVHTPLPQKDVVAQSMGAGFFGGSGVHVKPEETPQQEMEKIAEKLFVEEDRPMHTLPEKPRGVVGSLADEGEEIEYTYPEKMYGKQGTFSSYRVGPFTAKTRIRPGETRVDAFRRLRAELDVISKEEHDHQRAEFNGHFPKAFV